MKKSMRLISLVLSIVMILGMLPLSLSASEPIGFDNFSKVNSWSDDVFADVSPDDWFYGNVKSAFEYGLMIGKENDLFDAEGNVTAAETLTIAARLHAIYHTGETDFEETSPWYAAYADYCLENGIADPAEYDPDAPVTRAQFAVILANAMPDEAWESVMTVDDDAIPDVRMTDDFSEAVYKLYRAGVLVGNDSLGTFAPDSSIRRSEVAAIVTRMALPALRAAVPDDDGTYTVTFDFNFNNKEPKTVSVRAGETVSAPDLPVLEKYEFDGWYTRAAGGDRFDLDTAITGDTELYAHWKAISDGYMPIPVKPWEVNDKPTPGISETYYTMTFENNGGSEVESQLVKEGECALEPEYPTYDGYTFVSWYTDSSLTTLYDFDTVLEGDTTVYARWRENVPENRTFLDEPDPDVEIYSFDADPRSIPVGQTTVVTFTAEIFSNIALGSDDVRVMQDGELVGIMHDDGTDGDLTANDGVFTLQTELTAVDESYAEFCAAARDVTSDGVGVGSYQPMDEDDHDKIRDVDDEIRSLASDDEFLGADIDGKADIILDMLEELEADGLIMDGSIVWDEEHALISFRYESGIYGGISLMPLGNQLNGAAGASADPEIPLLFAGAGASAGEGTGERGVLVLNGFEDFAFRRDYYEDLKDEWDAIGLNTTVDVDVTAADMMALGDERYDVIVLSMHGNMYPIGGVSKQTPVLCLNEVVTDATDDAYSYDLMTRRTIARVFCSDWTFHYWLAPGFFGDHYSSNDLSGKLIFSESCMFYGCDCQGTTPDYRMAEALADLSAGAVVGYHNSVGSDYSRDVMKAAIEGTFGGLTISDALDGAKAVYGDDDRFEDSFMDKYAAYPIVDPAESQYILRGTGTVIGSVRDSESRNGVQDALIRIYDMDGELLTDARTDADGSYRVNMCAGEYVIKVTAGHYRSEKMAVTVTAGAPVYVDMFMMIDNGDTTGTTGGTVSNAVSGLPVSGVTVTLRSGQNNYHGTVVAVTETDENGYYEFSGTVGAYTIEYAKIGYSTGYKNIQIRTNHSTHNAAISQITSEGIYRFVLSWSVAPRDLDSHLTGPAPTGGRFRIFYPNAETKGGSPCPGYVMLDLDNTSITEHPNYPETITLLRRLDGRYVYTVHDFSSGKYWDNGALANSNAAVSVYQGTELIGTFIVPADLDGNIWTVFEMEGDTIIPVNRSAKGYNDSIELFDPYL